MAVPIGTLQGFLEMRDNLTSTLNSAMANIESTADRVRRIGQNVSNLGQTLTVAITLPLTAAAAASVKFARDFETSFTGVIKTTDTAGLSAQEADLFFDDLANTFREMAAGEDPIPIDVNELNRIGEAAGQLGIEAENIASFTETMAALGVTTNLTATQAASDLARLGNITGLAQTEFDRMGSTIVDLGNNFATTEAELVRMSLQIAGAGTLVNLTEGEILGFSAAMSSMGIQSERGGSAFSRMVAEMLLAVETGSEDLVTFASVAGMTGEAFATAFRDDAASAIELFILGLDDMVDSGGPVLQTLQQLGLDGIRVKDVLLRLAGGSDLVVEALDRQVTAWSENTALMREAELRYGTFESQLTIFWNRIKDVGITIGNVLIPILLNLMNIATPLIQMAANLANAFSNLDEGWQVLIVSALGLIAALGPILFFAGQIAIAWGTLALVFPTVAAAIASVAAFLLGPGGLIVAGSLLFLTWEPIRTFLWDLATRVFDAVKSGIGFIVDVMQDWWEKSEDVRVITVALAEEGIDGLSSSLSTASVFWRELIQDASDWISATIEVVSETEFMTIVVDTLSGAWETLTGWVTSALDIWARWIREAGGMIEILNNIVPGLGNMTQAVGDWAENVLLANEVTERWAAFQRGDFSTSIEEGVVSIEGANAAWVSAIKTLRELEAAAKKVPPPFVDLSNVSDIYTSVSSGVILNLVTQTQRFEELNTASTLTAQAHEALNNIVSLTSDEMEQLGPLVSTVNALMEQGAEITEQQLAAAIESLTGRTEEVNTALENFAIVVSLVTESVTRLAPTIDSIFGEGSAENVQAWANALSSATESLIDIASGISSGNPVQVIQGIVAGIDSLTQSMNLLFPSTMLVEERIGIYLERLQDGTGTVEDFTNLTFDLVRSMEKAAEGWGEGGRALALMEDNFSAFFDVARDRGPEGIQAITDLVNAATEAGIGLEVIAEKLAEVYDEAAQIMEDRSQFIVEQTESLVTNLTTLIDGTFTATAADVEFVAGGIVAAFGAMMESGMTFLESIEGISELFNLTNERAQELGLTLSDEFSRFGEIIEIVSDGPISNMLGRLEATGGAVEALTNLGLLTEEQFFRLQRQVINTQEALIDTGLTGSEALASMAPELQILLDASQQYNFSLDEGTQAMIDQGLEMGILTDQNMNATDIMIAGFDALLQGVNALIVALGGVPIEFGNWNSSSDQTTENIIDNFDDMRNSLGDNTGEMSERWNDLNQSMIDSSISSRDIVIEGYVEMSIVAGEQAEIADDFWREHTQNIGQRWNNMIGNLEDLPDGGGRGQGQGQGQQGFSHGSQRVIDFGQSETITVHGREQIVTEGEIRSLASAVGNAVRLASNNSGTDSNGTLLDLLAAAKDGVKAQHNTRLAIQAMTAEMADMKVRNSVK